MMKRKFKDGTEAEETCEDADTEASSLKLQSARLVCGLRQGRGVIMAMTALVVWERVPAFKVREVSACRCRPRRGRGHGSRGWWLSAAAGRAQEFDVFSVCS